MPPSGLLLVVIRVGLGNVVHHLYPFATVAIFFWGGGGGGEGRGGYFEFPCKVNNLKRRVA